MADLSAWRADLPPELELTRDNIVARKATNQLSQLVALHVYWGLCRCDLNRIALYGIPEGLPEALLLASPPEWLQATQQECFASASAVADMCTTVLTHDPDFESHDLILPTGFHECIRLQLWGLATLFPDGPARQQANAEAAPRLQACLILLRRTARHQPWVARRASALLRTLKERRWTHATYVGQFFSCGMMLTLLTQGCSSE